MNRERKPFVLVCSLIALLFLAGCSYKSVEVKEIGNIEIKNIQNNSVTVQISAVLGNPNPRLTISGSDMKFYLNNAELGKATLIDKVILEGKTTKKYTAKVLLEFTSLKNGVFSALSMLGGKKQDIKISGDIKVSSLFYWKTIQLKDYPVKL